MKKTKTQNKVEKKTIKELMKGRKPLLLNMELIAAVNKIFWKNAHRPIFGIADELRAAGFPAVAMFEFDKGRFQKLVGNLHRNVQAVREEVFEYQQVFHYPEFIRGKQSELIYFSLMQEQEFFDGNYGTLLMIFRKPRTNWCAPVIISCD